MRFVDRISFRLIVAFVAVVTVLGALFGSVGYYSRKSSMEAQLQAQVERAVARLEIGLPAPIWNVDEKQLNALLNAEMGDPAIAAIMIDNNKATFSTGRVRDEAGKIQVVKSNPMSDGDKLSKPFSFDDSGQLKPLGTVHVYRSRAQIDEELRIEMRQIILQVVVLDVALIAALIFGLRVVVLGSLARVRRGFEQVSSGDADLTRRIRMVRHDEIGELVIFFNKFIERLQLVMQEIQSGTESLHHAAGDLASGNDDLFNRTQQQANSLHDTASSMGQLTDTVKKNASSAHQANAMALAASEVAAKGGSVVSDVVSTMTSINESSRKIFDIIGVIDSIAFQTNILALNAAVEAARAGEQGRGFAVVASEVRLLAQRSAAAAKEIKALIGNSVEKVEVGSKLVNEAGTTMKDIVTSIQRVTDIMGEIMNASQAQMNGIDEVNSALKDMNAVTQQNARLVQDAASASTSMQAQSSSLAQVVAVFKVQ
jgi:methyl-accepting chemotaxis protein